MYLISSLRLINSTFFVENVKIINHNVTFILFMSLNLYFCIIILIKSKTKK